MQVKTFFDEQTFTLTHIVYDENSHDAVIIDPVLDLDVIAWETHTTSLQSFDAFIADNALKLHYVMDTHIHADHLSGMQYLKDKYHVPVVINAAISVVQTTFKAVFNLDDQMPTDGSQFDLLVKQGDTLQAGTLNFKVLHIPGHTPACTAYHIEDTVFTGDALFVPDIGTGRCDFPKGSAADLYDSITTKLYTLPDETQTFPGHDYPGTRELRTHASIGESKAQNVDLPSTRNKQEYIDFMNARDSRLPLPKLIYQGVQINLNAGQLPAAESNGVHYLKIPISNG